MKAVMELNKWANAHTNIGVDVIRVLLGVFLFYKGIFLQSNPEESIKVLESLPGLSGINLLKIHHIVASLHIVGGVFIALGWLTRISIVVLLPMLASALFVNLTVGMGELNLLQAGLTFIACACFLFYGSGKHSLDYLLKMHI